MTPINRENYRRAREAMQRLWKDAAMVPPNDYDARAWRELEAAIDVLGEIATRPMRTRRPLILDRKGRSGPCF